MTCKDRRETALLKHPTKAGSQKLRLTRNHIALLMAVSMTTLSGCKSLPSNAPTSGAIRKASEGPGNTLNYRVVELDSAVASAVSPRNEAGLARLTAFSKVAPPSRSDMILAGDELIVSIYEVGVSLFGNSDASALAAGMLPSSTARNIPITVREDGNITLPYVGVLKADGYYPEELADRIRTRLSQYSQSPQVLVNVNGSVGNSAYIAGAVVKAGRYRLTSAHERVLDMLTLAGGTAIDINAAVLLFTRRGESATIRLADLNAEDIANIQIVPGDRIEVRKERKTITVFGATDKVSEIAFDAPRLSLAEAVARSSGPADSRANARGVYLFRLEKDANEGELRPVIYHIDMMNPQTYFVAQLFQMQDKDVILYANSSSNLTQKFVSLINMLFSPALGIRYATQ